MELRAFITQTLVDIVGGVEDAQQKLTKGSVVPNIKKVFEAVQHGVSNVQPVHFEVTVRADEHAGTEAKLNVVTGFFGGGVKGESGKKDGHAATLKFIVPICFPEGIPAKEPKTLPD
jgi:hypothetical protein